MLTIHIKDNLVVKMKNKKVFTLKKLLLKIKKINMLYDRELKTSQCNSRKLL